MFGKEMGDSFATDTLLRRLEDGPLLMREMTAASSCTVSTQTSAGPRIVFRRATRADVFRMAREMRRATPLQAEAAGFRPKKMLWKSYHESLEIWAIEVESEGLAAVFGLGGPMLSNVGEPWLYTTPLVEKHPIAFVRCAREIVGMMLAITPQLEGFIYAEFAQGIRFLRALGFSIGETVDMGPNKAPFLKFSLGT